MIHYLSSYIKHRINRNSIINQMQLTSSSISWQHHYKQWQKLMPETSEKLQQEFLSPNHPCQKYWNVQPLVWTHTNLTKIH